VVAVDGRYELRYRASVPMEAWNAQISLLAGMEAARIMLAGGVGLLRTVPAPLDSTVRAIRRSAHALGFEWQKDMPLNEFLASVDRTTPHGAALVTQAARAFRGAGYETVDRAATAGGANTAATHAGVAAPYAHVTAPLRRLGDRYANEIVVALCAGVAPPSWATERLGELPSAMGHAQQREHALERAIVDYVETMVLRHRIGEVFDGTVTNVDEHGSVVQVAEPAVLTRVSAAASAQLGAELRLRLVSVDPERRSIDFEPV
jgi:exoribonuclease R